MTQIRLQAGEHGTVVLASPWLDNGTKQAHRITHKDGRPVPEDSDTDVQSLGSGGYGAVFRASTAIGLERAIKFVRADKLFKPTVSHEGYPILRHEVVCATARPHTHVLPILECTEEFRDDANRKWQYYVMPYVRGATFDSFFAEVVRANRAAIESRAIAREQVKALFLRLVGEALIGLVELNLDDTVHMDVSPGNVMVSLSGVSAGDALDRFANTARALIIDLGAAKQVPEGSSGSTVLICNATYFPLHIIPALGGERDQGGRTLIRYELLREFAPYIDAYCFAKTIALILQLGMAHGGWSNTDLGMRNVWRHILSKDYEYVLGVLERAYRIAREGLSVLELKDAFDAVRSPLAPGSADATLLSVAGGVTRIRVGRRIVSCGHPISELVDHVEFQSLRRLHQLPFLTQVFPGAGHNRFAHSVRAFDLLKRYIASLNRASAFLNVFQHRQTDEALTGALLRDVGQYPLAHACDELRQLGTSLATDQGNGPSTPAAHALLQIVDPSVRGAELIRTVSRDNLDQPSIGGILCNHGIDERRVAAIVDRSEPIEGELALRIARDLIGGSVGASRVSALMYDSHQTGVPYGRAIDIDSLLEGLTLGPIIDKRIPIGVDESGAHSAEAIVAATYWMHRNVYWHHSHRAAVATIRFVLRRLLVAGYLSFELYLQEVIGRSDLYALEFLESSYKRYLADRGLDAANPLSALVGSHRVGYDRVLSIGRAPFAATAYRAYSADLKRLAAWLSAGLDPTIEDAILDAMKRDAALGVALRDGELLFDAPLEPVGKTRLGEDVDVHLHQLLPDEGKQWIPLVEYSPLVKSLSEMEWSARKFRVFISAERLATIGDAQRAGVIRSVLPVLVSVATQFMK